MSSSRSERGEAVRGDRVSFWVDSTRDRAGLRGPLPAEADVVVVGAGSVGLTCAMRLLEAGLVPLVVDAGTVGGGVSGYTTAKLTAGHGLVYSRLEGTFETGVATLYARAQTSAIAFVRVLVATHAIDCETGPNYVFAETEADLERVQAETEAARRAGLEDYETVQLDAPFPALAAAALPGQSQFHPRQMGCVTWNEAEASWDCPCHASRFTPTGTVLHWPALGNPKTVDLPLAAPQQVGP